MAITASQLIATAKKLEGYKASAYSCTPNNWFYGYNVGGSYGSGSAAGLFSWYGNYDLGESNTYIGGRAVLIDNE